MPEKPPDPLDNTQSEAKTACDLGPLIKPLEFLEDGFALCRRNTDARIPYFDPDRFPRSPAPHQNATLGGVFDCVRDEVLDETPQEPPVRAHHEGGRHMDEVQIFLARQRLKFGLQRAEYVRQPERADFRLQGPRIKPRNIEQGRQNILDGFKRRANIIGKLRIARATITVKQRGDEQARGIQRLQNIVACRRQKPCFRLVCRFGNSLCLFEFRIEVLQFLRPLFHAPLERFLGANTGGDVGIGCDNAAIRKIRRAQLDHGSGLLHRHPDRRIMTHKGIETHSRNSFRLPRSEQATAGGMADNLVKPDTRSCQRIRQLEQGLEFMVPEHQSHLFVKNGDPLPDMVKRVLDQIAIILDRG